MKRLKTHAVILYLVCGVMQCRQVSCADSSMEHSFFFDVSVFINTFLFYAAINTALYIYITYLS